MHVCVCLCAFGITVHVCECARVVNVFKLIFAYYSTRVICMHVCVHAHLSLYVSIMNVDEEGAV